LALFEINAAQIRKIAYLLGTELLYGPEGDDLLLPLVEAKVLLLHVIMCDVSLTTQSDLSSTVASGKSAVDEV